MKLYRTMKEAQAETQAWRRHHETIALVPTMGNLHRGHLSLVERAKQIADKVIVSIFVNALQFGPNEDYTTYPRTWDHDHAQLIKQEVDAVFLPTAESMYPVLNNTFITVPELVSDLCGITRPQFFIGIATVVAKLFNIIQPHFAVFGEKDYQQCLVIKRMVNELNFPVTIITSPLIRESNGLAMSSRNHYLTEEEYMQAPKLYQLLVQIKQALLEGERDYELLENKAWLQLKTWGFSPDYMAIRCSDSLRKPEKTTNKLILLAAAYLGRARLIDNLQVAL